MEEWRPIPGYVGLYEVSDQGNIRGLDRYCPSRYGGLRFVKGCVRKATVCPFGYARMSMKDRHISESRFVHRIVAEAFVDGYFDGAFVNHINGDKLDNRAANLEWVTAKENTAHAINVLGYRRDGTFSGMSKLTQEEVDEIRRVYSAEMASLNRRGEPRRRPRNGVMEPYHMKYGRSLVCRITSGKSYKENV